MRILLSVLLLAGTAWGQQAAHPDPVPRGWGLMQLPATVPPLLQPHHKAPPGVDITGMEVEWDQYSPDPHRPGYYCAYNHKKLLKCGLPALNSVASQSDIFIPDDPIYHRPIDPTGTYYVDPSSPGHYCLARDEYVMCGLSAPTHSVNTCAAPDPYANYGCEFWEAGPIGFTRADYYGAYRDIVNVLDHAQLNNAEWENLDALAHAVNNVYLFLGTSKATEADATKAKLELDVLHIGEKLAKYHIPTHEEDMDELLRKMDGWGKKL